MLALLKKFLDGVLVNSDLIFDKTFQLIGTIFSELFTLVEWAFKVGTRLMLLYLTYQLVFEDLMDKILDAI